MTTRQKRTFILIIIIFIIALSTLACIEGGDMDRKWMTATVEIAITRGGW